MRVYREAIRVRVSLSIISLNFIYKMRYHVAKVAKVAS